MVEIGMACWHTSLFWEFRNCRDLLATLRPGNWRQPRQRRRGNCRTTITPRWCRSNFVRQFQSLCCRGWSLMILHTTGEGRRIAPCHALVVHDDEAMRVFLIRWCGLSPGPAISTIHETLDYWLVGTHASLFWEFRNCRDCTSLTRGIYNIPSCALMCAPMPRTTLQEKLIKFLPECSGMMICKL